MVRGYLGLPHQFEQFGTSAKPVRIQSGFQLPSGHTSSNSSERCNQFGNLSFKLAPGRKPNVFQLEGGRVCIMRHLAKPLKVFKHWAVSGQSFKKGLSVRQCLAISSTVHIGQCLANCLKAFGDVYKILFCQCHWSL